MGDALPSEVDRDMTLGACTCRVLGAVVAEWREMEEAKNADG